MVALAALLGSASAGAVLGQAPSGQERWFGLPLPPGLEPHVSPAIIGDRGPVPARVPEGEERDRELEGAAIRADLATIISFSKESRDSREVGEGQLWGRLTGFPSGARTIEWAVERFRKAGVPEVTTQSFEQAEGASFWLPTSWEVRLLVDRAFGLGSEDVILEAAMPLSPSAIAGGSLTAPLVNVGTASPAELMHIDVRGKVAVQHVTPRAHMVFERGSAVPRARDLVSRGAVAVLNVIDLPGNERARDFSNCGGPCFNLGGRDGAFLEGVMDRADEAATLPELRVRLTLETEIRTGLGAVNGVAVIRGSDSDESIVLNELVGGFVGRALNTMKDTILRQYLSAACRQTEVHHDLFDLFVARRSPSSAQSGSVAHSRLGGHGPNEA